MIEDLNLNYVNVVIGLAVIILNSIPLITKKHKYLLLTIIISLILMYIGLMI